MTFNENNVLNNFAAHRDSLLSEIRVASSELTEILNKKAEADDEYAAVLDKIANASQEHLAILASSEDEKQILEDRKNSIGAAEKNLKENAEEAERSQIAAEHRLAAIEDLIKERADRLLLLDRLVPEANEEFASMITATRRLRSDNEAEQEEHRTWRESADKERTDAQTQLNSLRVELKDITKELTDTKKLVAAEILKIEDPQQALANDFAKLARMKRNIDVYASRIERAHKKLYPDRPFTI